MTDLLVRLYDLPAFDAEPLALPASRSRRPLAPELHIVLDWIGAHFAKGWVAEASVALHQTPPTIFIAVGIAKSSAACYDATARKHWSDRGHRSGPRQRHRHGAAVCGAPRYAGGRLWLRGDRRRWAGQFYRRQLDSRCSRSRLGPRMPATRLSRDALNPIFTARC